jgi:pimeloyl-ACP methyl ester carboxylesterase
MSSVTLQASELEIHYRDAGSGPAVLLLHAFPLDSGMWASQIGDLSDHYRVLAPDFPGFGTSTASTGFTVDGAADLLGEFLDHLGVNERVVVAGVSMGGYVALAFARRQPQRLRALILADTKAEPDDETGRAGRDKMIELVRKEGPTALAEQMLPKLLGPATAANKADVSEQVRQSIHAQRADGIVAGLKALRDRPDARPGLSHVSVPTLVVVGEQDSVTPPANAKAISDAIPNSRLAVITGAGHLSNVENPAMFTAVVREFLNSLPEDQRSTRTV